MLGKFVRLCYAVRSQRRVAGDTGGGDYGGAVVAVVVGCPVAAELWGGWVRIACAGRGEGKVPRGGRRK